MELVRSAVKAPEAMRKNIDKISQVTTQLHNLASSVAVAAAVMFLTDNWIISIIAGVSYRGITVLYANYVHWDDERREQRIRELELLQTQCLSKRQTLRATIDGWTRKIEQLESQMHDIHNQTMDKVLTAGQTLLVETNQSRRKAILACESQRAAAETNLEKLRADPEKKSKLRQDPPPYSES